MSFRRYQGFAVPVVLLVGAVILVSVVTAASVTALGSRINVADEKVAYQALLYAESGVNSFGARFNNENYRGSFAYDSDNQWLEGLDLALKCTFQSDCASDTSDEAYLRILSVAPFAGDPSLQRITVQSEGTTANGKGKKVVLQDYVVRRKPGNPFGNVGAALTSYTPINISGDASVIGADGVSSTGVVAITRTSLEQTLDSGTKQGDFFDVQVEDATFLGVDQYVQVGEHRYKVKDVDVIRSSIQLEFVESLGLSAPRTIDTGTPVDLVPYAVTEITSSTSFRVTDIDGFAEGDTIYFRTDTSDPPVNAKASIVDINGDEITFSWDPETTPQTLEEGTPVTKDSYGATSREDVKVSGNAVVGPPYDDPEAGKNNLAVATPWGDPSLFQQTFNMTYTDFGGIYPVQGAWPTSDGRLYVDGVVHISGNQNLSGDGAGKTLCGSGTVVINGDLTINGTCDEGFRGLIYVKGNYSQQGNSNISGAVVVEGVISTDVKPKPSDDTGVTGTGKGDPKIGYDAAALYDAGMDLNPWLFEPIEGTWRQR